MIPIHFTAVPCALAGDPRRFELCFRCTRRDGSDIGQLVALPLDACGPAGDAAVPLSKAGVDGSAVEAAIAGWADWAVSFGVHGQRVVNLDRILARLAAAGLAVEVRP